MQELLLKRFSKNDFCTLGILLDYEMIPIACVLENIYLNNMKNVSSIPFGEYYCSQIESPKFGRVYEVKNVPNRTNILIHPGNIASDTTGCLLLGEKFGKIDGEPAVLNSRKTMDMFHSKMGFNDFMLRVIYC